MAGKIIEVTVENYDAEVSNSDLPVLVDFWATWCGPCLAIGPILEELSLEYDGKCKIAKVNVDEHQALAMKFGITSIPTLLLVKGGEVKEQIVGSRTKDAFAKLIDKHL